MTPLDLLHFLSFDAPSFAGQELDDISGLPYVPWRVPPSEQQILAWQVELTAVIEALAVLERWSPQWRREVLERVLLDPALTIPHSIRIIRALVAESGAHAGSPN
jgi:hypothetical protein